MASKLNPPMGGITARIGNRMGSTMALSKRTSGLPGLGRNHDMSAQMMMRMDKASTNLAKMENINGMRNPIK